MAFRRIFKRAKKKTIDATSDLLSAPSRSQSRARGRRADQLRKDVKVLRGAGKSSSAFGNASKYNSLFRRRARVQNYKSAIRSKKK